MVTVVDTRGGRPRHPEKMKRPDAPRLSRPEWIRVRLTSAPALSETLSIVRTHGLRTVCEEAACPNLGECWSKRHATFLIMGDICTRACAFCNVRTGIPQPLNDAEPEEVAAAAGKLGLAHVVITSVDRDDLPDGGAAHFARTIEAVRRSAPRATVEVLVPDFLRKRGAVETVMAARPDVFNHNLETVPSLYLKVRPGARYYQSLRILEQAKAVDANVFTKSGLMLGLGEERDEVYQVMDDLRSAGVDFLTIGQYLPPTPKHARLVRYAAPDEFESYRKVGLSKGFLLVSSTPLTRSSHHAGEDFERLRAARRTTPSAAGILP